MRIGCSSWSSFEPTRLQSIEVVTLDRSRGWYRKSFQKWRAWHPLSGKGARNTRVCRSCLGANWGLPSSRSWPDSLFPVPSHFFEPCKGNRGGEGVIDWDGRWFGLVLTYSRPRSHWLLPERTRSKDRRLGAKTL